MINIHQKEVGREASFYFQLIENMALSIFSHLLFIHSPWKWMDCYTPCLLSCWKCLPVLPSSPCSSHLALKHYLFQPCKSVFCDKVQLWAALLTLCCRKNSLATLFHSKTLFWCLNFFWNCTCNRNGSFFNILTNFTCLVCTRYLILSWTARKCSLLKVNFMRNKPQFIYLI